MGRAALYGEADELRRIRVRQRSARTVLKTAHELDEDKMEKRCARRKRAQDVQTVC